MDHRKVRFQGAEVVHILKRQYKDIYMVIGCEDGQLSPLCGAFLTRREGRYFRQIMAPPKLQGAKSTTKMIPIPVDMDEEFDITEGEETFHA